MKFGEMIKAHRPGLVVSPHHDLWMKNNGNPNYSSEAIKFGTAQLRAQAVPRDRSGTYSASSLNSCRRRQQFTFLGMPELPPTARTAAIFQNGTFMHIRWQMAGLTEGWLREAEVPLPQNSMRLNGTRDGIAHDGSVVEFKSIHTNGFSQVNSFGPKEDHLDQVGTYVAASGAEKAVVIYEDKNTQEYKEFVVPAEELPIEEITERAEELWAHTLAEQLYEPLSSCIEKEGYRYNNCPFRDRCLKIHHWDEVKESA